MEKTGIIWTEKTWNPLSGCQKVSAGCKYCYAETIAKKFHTAYPNGFGLTLRPHKLALGVQEFYNKKFKELQFTEKWKEAMGVPESNFKALIYGKPKNGKTEFCVMFAKYMTRFGKVLYNSFEQGHSRSLQTAWIRNNMIEVKGKITVTHKEKYDEMFKRLKKKKSPTTIIIDSAQYIKLTVEQWHELIETFPRKIFIVISHASGDDPKGAVAEAIQYDVDMSILVKGFVAHCASRFGASGEIMIYEKGHQDWLKKQRPRPGAAPVGLFPIPNEEKKAI